MEKSGHIVEASLPDNAATIPFLFSDRFYDPNGPHEPNYSSAGEFVRARTINRAGQAISRRIPLERVAACSYFFPSRTLLGSTILLGLTTPNPCPKFSRIMAFLFISNVTRFNVCKHAPRSSLQRYPRGKYARKCAEIEIRRKSKTIRRENGLLFSTRRRERRIILAFDARSRIVRGRREGGRGSRGKKKRSPVDGCCLEAPAKCPLTMAKRVLGPVKG